MATRKQKVKVGVFLAGCFALITFIITVIAGYYEFDGIHHDIIFSDSVSGLLEGAPVQYQGVPIGKVTSISVNIQNQVMAEVVVNPEKATLYNGVEAELVIYSFAAGTMAISLSGGDRKSGVLPPNSTIRAKPSALTAIGSKAEEVLTAVSELAEVIKEQIVTEDGEEGIIDKVAVILDQGKVLAEKAEVLLDAATQAIQNADGRITEVSEEARGLSGDIRTLARNADGMVTELRAKIGELEVGAMQESLDAAFDNVALITERLRETADGLSGTIANLEHDADNVSYEVRRSLADLRNALNSINRLADQLRQDPASLLRGRGEPR